MTNSTNVSDGIIEFSALNLHSFSFAVSRLVQLPYTRMQGRDLRGLGGRRPPPPPNEKEKKRKKRKKKERKKERSEL